MTGRAALFGSKRCSRCGGVWHPATGAEYSATFRTCGRCEREFWTWARGRIHWLNTIGEGHHAPGKKGRRRREE